MTVTYPFVSIDGEFSPRVPIYVINPLTGKYVKLNALIDSGAMRCNMPAQMAKDLGYNLNSTPTAMTNTVESNSVDTWVNKVTIHLLDPLGQKTIFISSLVDVNCINNEIPFILGDNFFSIFKITLDYPNKTVTFDWKQ